jgi:hypothetical protein
VINQNKWGESYSYEVAESATNLLNLVELAELTDINLIVGTSR